MISVPPAQQLSTYYQSYLKYIPADADLLSLIKEQAVSTPHFLSSVPADKESFVYAPGKWMLKEVAGHICDTERILSYRALRISRGDRTPLPGYDENLYTPNSNYGKRSLQNISDELATVRQATISLFSNMDKNMYDRTGTANDSEVSVRAICFFIAGHQSHHLEVIRQRYLS
jgi:hypothetical protein